MIANSQSNYGWLEDLAGFESGSEFDDAKWHGPGCCDQCPNCSHEVLGNVSAEKQLGRRLKVKGGRKNGNFDWNTSRRVLVSVTMFFDYTNGTKSSKKKGY